MNQKSNITIMNRNRQISHVKIKKVPQYSVYGRNYKFLQYGAVVRTGCTGQIFLCETPLLFLGGGETRRTRVGGVVELQALINHVQEKPSYHPNHPGWSRADLPLLEKGGELKNSESSWLVFCSGSFAHFAHSGLIKNRNSFIN
jgi:hypothetical protein